jgi:TonB family protein
MLRDEALRAAHEYEFKPLIRNGKTTAFVTELVFDFIGQDGIRVEKTNVVQIPALAASGDSGSPAPSFANPQQSSQQLKVIHREAPTYPEAAAPDHRSALVTVKMSVNQSGNVDEAEAVSGDPAFYKEAIATARKWRFEPFLRDGKPVRVTTNITFGFGYMWRAPGWQPATPPKRVRVSEDVSRHSIVHKVIPVYPQNAKEAHIQGSVVFRAIIGADGFVKELDTLKGPMELQSSAGDAVRQWQYKPYLLNGEPVEVEAQVTVNYTLSPFPN